ncbi:MAG: DUF354 domain-containing protein [Candidatus Berkelbacteria bacterium]
MRILIDLNHPAQVHFFKNFIWQMKKQGHKVVVSAYDKEVAFKLLKYYKIDYVNMGKYSKSSWRKLIDLVRKDWKLFFLARKFNPDILMGLGSINAAHIGWILNKPSLIFDDDEYSYPFYKAFTNHIYGFSGFKIKGSKIQKIAGFKEIAYLHSDYFKPDQAVLKELDCEKQDFFIIRLVAWQSGHDIGKTGLSVESVIKLVDILKKKGKVLISSEKPLPVELLPYGIKIAPERLHSALYYAKMLICDSQTMATEAAVLGTPVVRCNSWVGVNDMGNFVELEKKYGLMYSFNNADLAIDKVCELLKQPDLKKDWQAKQVKLFTDKVNVTKKMIELVEKIEKGHTFTF